jgi:hypothetical protein
MQQALKQNSMHQQLLQHMIEQQDLEIYDLMLQVCNIYSFYYYFHTVVLDLSLLKLDKAHTSCISNFELIRSEFEFSSKSIPNLNRSAPRPES